MKETIGGPKGSEIVHGASLSAILWNVPGQGKTYSRGIGDAWSPSKTNVELATITKLELSKINENHIPFLLVTMKLNAILWIFPGEEIILGVFLEMPGAPQKPKWAAATITKLALKLARSIKNQCKSNICLISPCILTRATTTKLSKSNENHV